jgi:hypothetical protein
MVNSIAAAAPALTSGNSIVLYRNILPGRYSIVVPWGEVVVEKKFDPIYENQPGHEILYYDRQGRFKTQFQKGALINTYF